MLDKKKEQPKEKPRLHPRNKNRERYDFKLLVEICQELEQFVKLNKYNEESIDFADPESVKMLNKALLKYHYGLNYWDIPPNYLTPPIPGRSDYIHHIADLLRNSNYGKIPLGEKIICLDIGVGANCIYPIIGNKEYGWSFIGSDTDSVAIESANKIIELNSSLQGKVKCILQTNPKDFFYGIIKKDEIVDLSICNPPFHASAKDAHLATMRKLKNLSDKKNPEPILNFGGQNNELWYDGGEDRFVRNMINQSKKFSTSCFWFSSLISKQSSLKNVYTILQQAEAIDVITIPMGQGNKTSRIVAWTFLAKEEQKNWKSNRWKNAL
ncbi:MAG: 23S rRNA (adenine(1618)-N(6))-methyltransferase RlmF [Bacteroidales bacterium]|nr:23S rRNA (adenine(1618)-N(6))-methyltransferase RlmF [Bacteroidales bacterium]MBN2757448.1 23S rRNA (adenine(1618)-N(6))-methyltransferase RlmF [Bacteroidales bacterium]